MPDLHVLQRSPSERAFYGCCNNDRARVHGCQHTHVHHGRDCGRNGGYDQRCYAHVSDHESDHESERESGHEWSGHDHMNEQT